MELSQDPRNVYMRNYRASDSQRAKQKRRSREYRLGNYEKHWLARTEQRCTKNGWLFNLTIDDLKIPEVCPALGCKIIPGDPYKWQSPSIDRIDPSKGYVKGNIRIISFRANQVKSNSSLDEMEKVVNWYRGVV